MLPVGSSVSVQGSGKNPYIITCKQGPNGLYLYCPCLAWKFIKAPSDSGKRICKHCIVVLKGGGSKDVTPATPKSSKKKPQSIHKTVSNNKHKVPSIEVALAEKWTTEDPTGYFMSEKLDGMRCIWDGSTLQTRNGNIIHAPDKLIKELPSMALDGELFLGRGKFQELMSITKRHVPNKNDWSRVQFMVFDAPEVRAPFQGRLNEVQKSLISCNWASMHIQQHCNGHTHVMMELDRILKLGGEGVMLRYPTAHYTGGRTTDLLKVKQFHDAEAYVRGYKKGTGRNKDRMGALYCEDKDGITFKVGTGFPDSMRDTPPSIGTKITYQYQEKTVAGKPRFPIFMRTRID